MTFSVVYVKDTNPAILMLEGKLKQLNCASLRSLMSAPLWTELMAGSVSIFRHKIKKIFLCPVFLKIIQILITCNLLTWITAVLGEVSEHQWTNGTATCGGKSFAYSFVCWFLSHLMAIGCIRKCGNCFRPCWWEIRILLWSWERENGTHWCISNIICLN